MDSAYDPSLCTEWKIGLVLANGTLPTQSSGEDNIGKNIITMPMQLFYSVTIQVTLWFITKGKKQSGKTLFIDVRTVWKIVRYKVLKSVKKSWRRYLHVLKP